MLGRGAHRELIHVRLTDNGHSGLVQTLHNGCVVGRQPAFKDLRRAGRRQASGHHIVLHGDRNAGQAREIFTCSATSIDLGCSCKCAFTIDVEESVDLGIDRINTVEACLSEFNRGDLSASQQLSKLAC